MTLPFTQIQFLDNFADYNEAIFPMQIVLLILAFFTVYQAIWNSRHTGKILSGALGFLWLWMGVVYHLAFFSGINKASYLFGGLFIIQGLLFIFFGVIKGRLNFNFQWDKYSITGIALVVYALIVYPMLGFFFGHTYPQNPTFGAPCPTTIFTFGILLIATRPINKILLIIPFIWSIIGFSAALTLGIREDVGLLVAGIVGTVLIWLKNKEVQ